jgi:hypothetical protein
MADWRTRAKILGDVVEFRYSPAGLDEQSEEVYVWDIDKTYLDTSLGSVRDLLKTALERAFQKKNIPGTSSLVRALLTFWEQEKGNNNLPIFFITASPPQMETRIREKLLLDGISPLGAFFKDNLKNLRPNRFWRLTKQVGYKLQALLQLRTRLREDVRQVFWGDDSESDVIIYNLYSDICSRRLDHTELADVLRSNSVTGEQLTTIIELQEQIPPRDPVEKIYINLADDTDPDYYLKFGRRTVATTSTFQVCLDLFQDGRLSETQVLRVGQDMMMNYHFTPEEFERALDALIRRQILGKTAFDQIEPLLKSYNLITKSFEPTLAPRNVIQRKGTRVFELEGNHEPWVPEHIDYLHDYR